MSMIERKTSFQPTGGAGWPICLLPHWRGGAASVRNWWHKDALLACDFREGRFVRGGTELAAEHLFTTTRASAISLPDDEGILQTLGINTLPQTTRGLFPNHQVTNSIRYSEDLTPANWTKDAVTISPLHYRYLSKIIETETNATHGLRVSSSIPIEEGEVRRVSLDVKAAGRSVITLSAYSSFSTGTTLRVNLTDGSFTGGTNAKVTPLGDGIFRIETSGVGTANGTASVVIRIGDAPYMGDGVSGLLISRVQMNAGDYFPLYVPTPTNAVATTLASDIRLPAVGMGDGFTVLMDCENKFVRAGTRDAFALLVGTSSHLRINTASNGGGLRASTPGSGSISFPGGQVGRRSRIACRVLGNGAMAMAQQGAATLAMGSGSPDIGAATRIMLGNTSALTTPWNDWIYGLQICKPISDQEMLDWVNAA